MEQEKIDLREHFYEWKVGTKYWKIGFGSLILLIALMICFLVFVKLTCWFINGL